MYERQFGDGLCSKDKRLKFQWRWSRIASCYTTEQLKKWTHFQCSFCSPSNKWELEAVQWSSGEDVNYEAKIRYKGTPVEAKKGFKTRIDAQVAAENLLVDWIKKQYSLFVGDNL